MSNRNLHHLLAPHSTAIIGATPRPHSVGATVLANLVEGRFAGPVWPVNPKYDAIAGLKTYARVAELPEAPDVAVICTPPATIPELIGQLGERGCKSAIVLGAGIDFLDAPGKTAGLGIGYRVNVS